MPDRGRPVTFGWFLVPDAADPPGLLDQARRVERAGFDLIGIQDHPYQRRYLDTFSLLGALATATERIGLFPDVANLPLRHPAMLAKAAASIDLLSGGRFELGLGAGAFWDAVVAMGGPRRAPGEAVEALEEAITLVRLLWGGSGAQGAEGDSPRSQGPGSVRFAGRHYRVAGVKPGPSPAHPIRIWLGAIGPRMLAVTGRVGDGWVPSSSYVPPERLPAAQARIDDAAAAAGRDPADVRRLYNISGRIGPGGGGFLDGPAGQWVEQLLPLVTETGMDTFVLWPTEAPDRQLELFAAEVAPALREAVAAHRGRGCGRLPGSVPEPPPGGSLAG